MAASFRAHLVLDVHAGGARFDHRPCRTRHIEGRGAESGVDIDQKRQVAHVRDAAHVGGDIVKRGDAKIRQAERSGRHAAAGKIDGAESGLFGQQGVIGVDGTGNL